MTLLFVNADFRDRAALSIAEIRDRASACVARWRFKHLNIKCNGFSFVEVNVSSSVFNINKSIWVLRKITKITNLLKKRFKVRHRRFVYILQVMMSYRENDDYDDQLK